MTAERSPADEKPSLARRFARLLLWSVALLVVVVGFAWGVLESDWLREVARRAVERRTAEALGRAVAVGAIDLDLWSLGAVAEAVVIGGPDGLEEPLLRAGRITVRFGPGVLGALRGRGPLVLEEIEVGEPVLDLRFAADGTSNLPDLGGGDDGAPGLEVRVESVVIGGGVLRLEERSVPVDLTARQVSASLRRLERGGHRARAESGELSIRLAEAAPLPAALAVTARVGDGRVTLERARLEGPLFQLEASGEVASHDLALRVAGDVDAGLAVHLGWLDGGDGAVSLEAELAQSDDGWTASGTWRSADLSTPELGGSELAGDFQARGRTSPDGLAVWAVEGDWHAARVTLDEVTATGLEGSFEAGRREDAASEDWSLGARFEVARLALLGLLAEGLEGSLEGGPRGVEVELASGRLDGAPVSGRATIPLAGARRDIDTVLEVSGLELSRLLGTEDPLLVGVDAAISAAVSYTFDRTAPERGRGAARVTLAPPGAAGAAEGLALEGSARLAIADGRVRAEEAVLTAAGQRIVLSGEYELATQATAIDFTAAISDPQSLLTILPAFAASPGEELWEPTRGRGEVSGSLSADATGFRADLHLALDDLVLAGSPVDHGGGRLVIDSGGLQSIDVVLEHGEARLQIEGAVPFESPPPAYPAPELRLGIRAERWRLADARPWVPFAIPLDGGTSGTLAIEGSLEALAGALEIEVDDLAISRGELPGRLSVRLDFDPGAVDLTAVRYAAPFGDLELTGEVDPGSGVMDLRLASSPLDLAAPPIDDLVAADLTGWVEIAGSLGGTLEQPEGAIEIIATGVDLDGRPLGEEGASRVSIEVARGDVVVDGSLFGLLTVTGGGSWDGDGVDVEIGLDSDRVAALAALALTETPEGLSGSAAGGLRIAGAEGVWTARLVLERLELDYRGQRLRNLEPVALSFVEGGMTLESFYLGEAGTESEIFLAGSFGSATAPGLDLVAQSSIDAGWLELYLPDLDFGGRLELLATIHGSLDEPRFDGQAKAIGGRLLLPDFPHAVEEIEGLVFLYPDLVVVDSARAAFARGEVTAEGAVFLEGEVGGSYELRLSGRNLDIRYPEEWRILADGRLTLSSAGDQRLLSGVVTVEQAAYVRDFELGLTQLLRAMFERRPVVVDETDEILLQTRLNIDVRGPDALQLRTDVATLGGDLDFTVRGSLGRPVILGDIRLERDGTIELAGTTYTVERGSLVFSNPFRNDPYVDVVAAARVREFDVRLNVFGPVENLQTTVSSTPPLPSLDVLSLLTTGSADLLGSVGSRSGNDSESSSAETFLAGQAASLAGKRVGELFGLDQVRITPLTSGTSTLSTARLTVGKRISRDLYLTYSNDPSSSSEEVVELRWQIYPQIAIILTGSDEDSYTFDVRWNKSF